MQLKKKKVRLAKAKEINSPVANGNFKMFFGVFFAKWQSDTNESLLVEMFLKKKKPSQKVRPVSQPPTQVLDSSALASFAVCGKETAVKQPGMPDRAM